MTTEDPNYDTRTYIDAAGVERWQDDDKPVNQNTAFRCTFEGSKVDIVGMSRNAVIGRHASQRHAKLIGTGKTSIRGMSRRADELLAMRQVNAYGKALSTPEPNWASMNGKKGRK